MFDSDIFDRFIISKKRPKGGYYLYFFAWLVVLIVAVFFISVSADYWIKSILIDDAAYYPIIAWNIAHGNGPTVDGMTCTNGFHPLWGYLSILSQLIPASPLDGIVFFKIQVILTVLFCVFIWDKLLATVGINLYGRAVFILLMGAFYKWSIKVLYSGMETPLVLGFIGLSLLLYFRIKMNDNYSKKNLLLLGLILSLTFLSRLDSIFFIFLIVVLIFSKLKNTKIFYLIIPFLLVIPYLVYNFIYFGNIIPVSGLRKRYSVFIDPEGTFIDAFVYNIKSLYSSFTYIILSNLITYRFVSLLILLICALVAILIIFKGKEILHKTIKNQLLIILLLSTIFHALYYLMFGVELHVNWHQYLIFITMYLFLSIYTSNAYNITKRTAGFIFIAIAIACISQFKVISIFPRPQFKVLQHMADFVKQNMANERFYLGDTGYFILLTGTKTFAGNGLVGNQYTLKAVLEGRWKDICKKYKIKYLISKVPAEKITSIQEDNNIAYVSQIFNDNERKVAWVISKIDLQSIRLYPAFSLKNEK